MVIFIIHRMLESISKARNAALHDYSQLNKTSTYNNNKKMNYIPEFHNAILFKIIFFMQKSTVDFIKSTHGKINTNCLEIQVKYSNTVEHIMATQALTGLWEVTLIAGWAYYLLFLPSEIVWDWARVTVMRGPTVQCKSSDHPSVLDITLIASKDATVACSFHGK